MGGLLRGVGKDRRFRRFFHPILRVRLTPVAIEQGFDATFGNSILVAIEGVSRQPHHLAGFRYVAQFRGQIQQADLVTNDILVELPVFSPDFSQNRANLA